MEDVPALQVALRSPTVQDAPSIWKLVRAATNADSDSSYFYLLWCHEFSSTSVVATAGSRVVGVLLGYLRQDQLDTLVVWQEVTDPSCHFFGLRLRMLDEVIRCNAGRGIRFVETTGAPHDENVARLVNRFARRRAARVVRRALIVAGHLPDVHSTEILYNIGPLGVLRN